MIDVKNLDIETAKKALKDMRLYQDMVKKLGKRGKKLFVQKTNGTHSFIVEYYPSVGKEYALEKALNVYSKAFSITPRQEEVQLFEKEHLLSGLKVYLDDNCVDLSFKNIEYKLSK